MTATPPPRGGVRNKAPLPTLFATMPAVCLIILSIPSAISAQVASLERPLETRELRRSAAVINRTDLGTWAHYVPADPRGVLVLAHGYPWPDDSRTSSQLEAHTTGYVERWREFAEDVGLVLLVPAFGSGDLAGYRELFGKRVDADSLASLLAERYGKALVPGYDGRFYLYGHSAGGQFATRFLVTHPDRLAGVILSAPGTFPFPDEAVAWPYGAGPVVRDTLSGSTKTGKPADEASGMLYRPDVEGWRRAAAVPVHIVIGLEDIEPRADRPAQTGSTRIERAMGWVRRMHQLAPDPTHRTLLIHLVPGVGHDPVALTGMAQEALAGMLTAERPGGR